MTWDNWMHGSSSWMALWMLVFWGAFIALTVWLVRDARAGHTAPAAGRARDLLAEQYARGEIDSNEFQTRAREIEALMR